MLGNRGLAPTKGILCVRFNGLVQTSSGENMLVTSRDISLLACVHAQLNVGGT